MLASAGRSERQLDIEVSAELLPIRRGFVGHLRTGRGESWSRFPMPMLLTRAQRCCVSPARCASMRKAGRGYLLPRRTRGCREGTSPSLPPVEFVLAERFEERITDVGPSSGPEHPLRSQAGARRAIGLPARAITTSSPASAKSSRRECWVLASRTLTVRVFTCPRCRLDVRTRSQTATAPSDAASSRRFLIADAPAEPV